MDGVKNILETSGELTKVLARLPGNRNAVKEELLRGLSNIRKEANGLRAIVSENETDPKYVNEIVKKTITEMLSGKVKILPPTVPSSEKVQAPERKNEVLVIKSPQPDAFIKTIKETINPLELRVRILSIKKMNPTAIIVEVANKLEGTKFKKELLKAFKDLTFGRATMRQPEIVIYDTQDIPAEDIRRALAIQTKETPKLLKVRETVSGKHRTYIRMSKKALRQLEEFDPKRIFIGYRKCYYSRHVSVTRCYKCHRFGHVASKCQAEFDELDTVSELKIRHKCSNCFFVKKWSALREEKEPVLTKEIKEGILAEIDHDVFSSVCPTLLAVKDKLRKRTDY